jgi:hypothetical protein
MWTVSRRDTRRVHFNERTKHSDHGSTRRTVLISCEFAHLKRKDTKIDQLSASRLYRFPFQADISIGPLSHEQLLRTPNVERRIQGLFRGHVLGLCRWRTWPPMPIESIQKDKGPCNKSIYKREQLKSSLMALVSSQTHGYAKFY